MVLQFSLYVIDKLCALYTICDISELLDQDGKQDTIVHFYEDFLTHYDPELRKSLGVFYTPSPVVRYLIGMVDKLLVEDFEIDGGLSNKDKLKITVQSEEYKIGKQSHETQEVTVPRVAVLDPACGTGTFHAEIIKYIKKTYFSDMNEAFYPSYIMEENGLLPRLIGFEIMITSYAVAHLNIRRAIVETLGTVPKKQLPTNIYLTNTLAKPNSILEQAEQTTMFDFTGAITDEAYKADTWKTRRPIKVIIGNPPYLGASTNPYDISAYRFEVDGTTPFGERKDWLNNDYVKFFRFAEEIICKYGEGVLAYVSPHGFLDDPTSRGMRASFLRTFDKIYIVNLHGNAQEKPPDGDKDENIFDIKQGVSLFIGIKTSEKADWAEVFHADLRGTRENKFLQLETNDVHFTKINPDKRMAYFIPFGNDNKDLYDEGISVKDLFSASVSGIGSGRDSAAITFSRQELEQRINMVKNAISDKPIEKLWGKFTQGQTASKIKADVLGEGVVTPISYRLFDTRWTYYSGNSCGWLFRPREKSIMGHLLAPHSSPIGANIGLVFCRLAPLNHEFSMIFVSEKIIEAIILSPQTSHTAQIAPLYLHSENAIEGEEWTPNFSSEALAQLTQNLATQPTPIEIFDYVYGILHDPVYCEKYNEFLKRDFPRVPIIENEETFQTYISAGEKLRKLHLMQTKTPATLALEPNTAEDLEIGAVKYKDGVLHLNKNKQIHGIPENVWNYRIGGYQVIDKWLKSHKGKTMTKSDFNHIANITGLLEETIKIQDELNG